MVMRRAVGRRALMGGPYAEEMVWISVEPPGAKTFFIDRLPVWDRPSIQHTHQRLFYLVERTGICEKLLQSFFGSPKDAINRRFSFERAANIRNQYFQGIACSVHTSHSFKVGNRISSENSTSGCYSPIGGIFGNLASAGFM
jgi:hypothetical protein